MSLTTIIQKLIRGAAFTVALSSCSGSLERPECQDDYDCSEQEVCVEGECLDGCSRDLNTEREFLDLEGKILFERDDDIYVMDAITHHQLNLTKTPSRNDHDPILSPDGTTILFRSCDKVCDIYLMDTSGGNQRNITASLEGVSFSPRPRVWSPDGSKIVFSVFHSYPRGSDLYTIDITTGNYLQLTNSLIDSSTVDQGAVWSPDGTTIVFHLGTSKDVVDIFTIDVEGKNMQNQTINFTPNAFYPYWSPDGNKIVFSATQGEYLTDIYSLSRKDSNIHRLTNNHSYNSHPLWSEDGRRIAFISSEISENVYVVVSELYIMDAEGGSNRLVVKNRGSGKSSLAWSPDERKIVFEEQYGSSSLYLVDVNNCAIEQLTTNGSNPFWYGGF